MMSKDSQALVCNLKLIGHLFAHLTKQQVISAHPHCNLQDTLIH